MLFLGEIQASVRASRRKKKCLKTDKQEGGFFFLPKENDCFIMYFGYAYWSDGSCHIIMI